MDRFDIYPIECDFCSATTHIKYVDVIGEPEFYHACIQCIVEKGWS